MVSGAGYCIRLIPGRANYVTAVDGQFELAFGTSSSAPVVGSMIAMINDARLSAGKGPVGGFQGLSTERKCHYFDPQASSILQFTPLRLHVHSTILPLGTTQAVVCALILSLCSGHYTQTCDPSDGWFYCVRICSCNPHLDAKPLKCGGLGSRHWYVALPAFPMSSFLIASSWKGLGTPNFKKLLPLFLGLP